MCQTHILTFLKPHALTFTCVSPDTFSGVMLSHEEGRGASSGFRQEVVPLITGRRDICNDVPTTYLCLVMPRGGGAEGMGSPNLPTSLLLLLPPPAPRQTPLLAYRTRAGPPSPASPSLPRCPAHPGGLLSSPARANPWLGVSRASRFLVLRKTEQGVAVGRRRQRTGGSEQRGEPVYNRRGLLTRKKTPTHSQEKTTASVLEDSRTGDPPRSSITRVG